MKDLAGKVDRLEEAARRRTRRETGYPLVLILRPGDSDPVVPEGAHPLIIDARHNEPLPDPFPAGMVIDAQDLRL